MKTTQNVIRHAAPIVFAWDAESTRIVPMKIQILRGETILLAPRILHLGRAATLPKKTVVELWWKPVKETEFWGPEPGKAADGGVVIALFTPAMDNGSAAYDFFVRAQSPAGILYRAHGVIEVRPSPGANPSDVQVPAKTLDFEKIVVLHPELAPWLGKDHDTDPKAHLGIQGKIGGMIGKLKKTICAALTGAEGSATQAKASAKAAAESALEAVKSASQAGESATSASNSAAEATSSAQGAESAKDAALGYADDAQQSAEAAAQEAAKLAGFREAVDIIAFTPGASRSLNEVNQLLDALVGALKGD